MNLRIKTKDLLELINLTSRFVAKNTTLPILENVYLQTNMDSLILKGSDMEKYIQIQYPAEILAEGAITIKAKTLAEILANIEEEFIELKLEENLNSLIIQTSEDKFKIVGIPANEYIAVPEINDENQISLELEKLNKGIEMVGDCIVEKNFLAIITGMLLRATKEEDGNKLIFVGTDSFRLAEFKFPIEEELDFSVVIPKSNLLDIKKVIEYGLEKDASTTLINFKQNLIKFGINLPNGTKIEVTSLLLKGNYPNYKDEKIMPTQFNTKIIVDKNSLAKAIKKILIFTKDLNNYIKVEGNNNELIISTGKIDKGEATTRIPASIEGNPISVMGMNGKFILDFIKYAKSEQIIFNIKNENSPFLLTDPKIKEFKYINRPIELE